MSNSNSNGSGNVRVEIYFQTYHLRGSDPEYIAQLAEYVDNKMRLISQQAATVDSLRVAVLAALNIADELHVLKRKYDCVASDYSEQAEHLADALEEVLQDERRADSNRDREICMSPFFVLTDSRLSGWITSTDSTLSYSRQRASPLTRGSVVFASRRTG